MLTIAAIVCDLEFLRQNQLLSGSSSSIVGSDFGIEYIRFIGTTVSLNVMFLGLTYSVSMLLNVRPT